MTGVSIVAACSRNRVIGRSGALPWRLPTDLQRFRQLTLGQCVVMGRKTYESLPSQLRPLPDRRNLVLTSRWARGDPAGVEAFTTLPSALAATEFDCFVIGGEQVFREALPFARRIYLTAVDTVCEGDAFFPAIDDGWTCIAESPPMHESGLSFTFRTYDSTR